MKKPRGIRIRLIFMLILLLFIPILLLQRYPSFG